MSHSKSYKDGAAVKGSFAFYHYSNATAGTKQASIVKYEPPTSAAEFMSFARRVQDELQGVRVWAPLLLKLSHHQVPYLTEEDAVGGRLSIQGDGNTRFSKRKDPSSKRI